MAKLNSETIEIKISELLKDNVEAETMLDNNLIGQLIEVIETLVGEKRLVEVTRK
jgi:hypothetical protein